MLTITKRNSQWEAHLNGGLLSDSDNLDYLLRDLTDLTETIEEELNN